MTKDELRGLNISTSLVENEATLRRVFHGDSIFNLRYIAAEDGKSRFFITYFDGMVNNQIIDLHVVEPLGAADWQLSPDELAQGVISTDNCKVTDKLEEAVRAMIDGDTLVFTEGYTGVIYASTKGFKSREPGEPDSEKTLRGPHEGFTESLIGNTALLRRKLQTPDLKMEIRSISSSSEQRMCVCYLDEVVDKNVLGRLYKRLDGIDLKNALSSNYIEEYISDWKFSTFKTVGETEKPDIAAAKLLEGRIVIIVDGSPGVLTLPYLFLEYFQSGNDYYTNFWLGTAGRLLRIMGVILSVSVPAIYIALVGFHKEMIPVQLLLAVASSREGVPFPAILELYALLVVFDLLREAGIMMPQSIGNALSTVGGVVIGQAAVDAKFVSAPMVIIVALTGLTDMMVPNLKQSMLVVRFLLLTLTAVIGLYGYLLGMMFTLAALISMKSFGIPYMSYLASWHGKAIYDTAIRAPMWMLRKPSVREELESE
jgi:spore germination protein KA